MTQIFKSSSINYGVYLGILLTLLTGTGYIINLELFTEIWFGVLFIIVVILCGIISIASAKKLLGGFISFKDAFTAFFITLLIGISIGSLTNFLIFSIIDTAAAIELQEKMINSQIDRLEAYNVPSDVIDDTIEKMEAQGNIYSISNILRSLVLQIAGYSVVGLIVSALMKKRNTNAE